MARPVVAHYVARFLSLTEGWIHDQLRYAKDIDSIVLTKKVINQHELPWSPLYATNGSPWQEISRATRGFYPIHAAACRRHGARLLHAHFGHRGVFARGLAKHLGVPLVTSFYGRDLGVIPRRGYGGLFRDGALFVAEGPAARERLIDLGCDAGKIHIHRLGVNPDEIPFTPRRRQPHEPLRILTVGRFVEKKGFVYAVRAFLRASESAALNLTIVGDAGPDRDEQRIKRELVAAAASARGKITFCGFLSRTELMEQAASHHILLQPSVTAADGDREGGHPVVLTLLAAAGMPAIGTRHCDIPEVVHDGTTGWLCDERDVSGLAAALLHAFEADLEPMGRAARELIAAKYDIRQQTLTTAYKDLL